MAIYGNIDDLAQQAAFGSAVLAGIKYLKTLGPGFLADKPVGYAAKTEIRGTDMFATHQVYETKPVRRARYEAHRNYIDLQYVWEGTELIAVASLEALKTIVPYDKEKDIEFFKYFPAASFVMEPGVLAILFPSDAHAPCLSVKKPQVVRKTVVKMRAGGRQFEQGDRNEKK